MLKLLLKSWRPAARLGGIVVACVAVAACTTAPPATAATPTTNSQPQLTPDTFSFVTAGDVRNFAGPAPAGKRYFDGLCEALQSIGAGAFMISPGDSDPPGPIRATIDKYLGTNYLWYPVVGNHELGVPATLTWFRRWAKAGIPYLTRRGPAGAEDTTYSFEFENSHFIVLNEYYDGHSDAVAKNDLPQETLDWLEKDLAATHKPLIWVIGHVPIKSLPDMDTGRLRHGEGGLTTNTVRLERFVQLLKQSHVRAYICGHTHDCSVARVKGIWQADSGHGRGAGDTGAPSTFLKFRIAGERAWVDVYRGRPDGQKYELKTTVELD